MAVILQQLPFGRLLGGIWFLLLFFAGLTSAVAITQPAVALLQEGFDLTRRRAVALVGLALLILSVPALWWQGALDELDFWAGTFALLLFGFAEAVIFGWIFGIERGWSEITRGAEIRVPSLVKPVLKYVTPVFLGVILLGFAFQSLGGTPASEPWQIWAARGLMLAIFAGLAWMVRVALREVAAEEAS